MYSFCDLEPVDYSMSGSNCCFLTCIQVSQEAGKVVWYSPLFWNISQFGKVKVKSLSRVLLCDPVDCSAPSSSIPGIVQARILEWVAISFPRGSS